MGLTEPGIAIEKNAKITTNNEDHNHVLVFMKTIRCLQTPKIRRVLHLALVEL
jgi:hypothetical protein